MYFRQQQDHLRHHLEDSEDICTSHHKVLLAKVKEGAGEADKFRIRHFTTKISYLCSTPVAGWEVRTMLNMLSPILASLKSSCCLSLFTSSQPHIGFMASVLQLKILQQL